MSAKVKTSTPKTFVRRSASQVWRRLLIAFVVGIMASQSIGCIEPAIRPNSVGVFDQSIAGYRDMVWAKRAYNLRYASCERQYGNHFRKGFIDGYCSVCNGDKGYVPAMPPEDYWSSQFQCAEGANCVNAWFEGYPVGAQAAKKSGAGSYHDIYISKMINSAIVQEKQAEKIVSPSNVPITAPRAARPQAMIPPIVPGFEASAATATPAVAETIVDTTKAPLPMNEFQPASYETTLDYEH